MPVADRRLLQVIADAVEASTATIDLQSITGETDLLALAQTLGLASADAATWHAPDTYARVLTAARWLQQRRLKPDSLATLLSAARVEADALAPLRALARKRFIADADWYRALTPAMDVLRVHQRDALLGHILHTNSRGWSTADQVYAAFLIDVQMGPCQLSSRIVQAHGAVQLFVQRCLMNLERADDILLGDVSTIAQWRQWDWMKNFRVWEAARKVFLYPENWIEPDLRDVKSPFFIDLENQLLQGEVTPLRVEQAVRSYLTKLHDVARLDIRALHEEIISETSAAGAPLQRKVLHMVGRTRALPHRHFYRQRCDDLSWTPWEELDLNIDTDLLSLVVQNGRAALFWPQFKEVQVGRYDPPRMRWEISLAWSVRDAQKWQAPRTGSAFVTALHFSQDAFALRSSRDGSQLGLTLYSPLGPWRLPTLVHEFTLDVCAGDTKAIDHPAPWHGFALPVRTRLLGNKIVATGEAASALFLTQLDLGWRVYQPEAAVVILRNAPAGHSLLATHQQRGIKAFEPFVFADAERQYLATPGHINLRIGTISIGLDWYRFSILYHPYACRMLQALEEQGLDGLYRSPEPFRFGTSPGGFPRQLHNEGPGVFQRRYDPTGVVWRDSARAPSPYPIEEFDFSHGGAYSLYNWEVFFHIPLLLADRLSKNGRFEDAQRQFHMIFDPTDVSWHGTPHKFWRVKPLFQEAQRWSEMGALESLEAMMARLAEGADDVAAQVDAWRDDPFNPHLLARIRLGAYMKTVVQKYIDNLIAWGDSLFRQDTMESINSATQLYVLGSEIVGAAPVVLPAKPRTARSYHELTQEDTVDAFANVLVDIETSLPLAERSPGRPERVAPGLGMLYFCIPGNPRLAQLRTTIADRLFKIRHCMDIEGRVRQLALFAPPIDPAMLVRARAAGLDIGTALTMALGARPPHYRFQPLLQKALEVCGEVRGFGNALLSTLEKGDGEQLAQLRSRHEVGILKRLSTIKAQQVAEAGAGLEAIWKSRAVVLARRDYYADNLAQGLSAPERAQIEHLHEAHRLEMVNTSYGALASVFHALPTTVIGFPCNGTEWGGPNLGHAMQAAGSVFGMLAQQWTFEASMSGYNATYGRRTDDWRQQLASADLELAQVDQQIAAADIRLKIAEQDQTNHEQQIADAEEVQAALRGKFTNTQLYSWMSAQLASLHYQSYRMAFDLAKQAEAAAQRDLVGPVGHIQFGHWDGGRQGLLAGERLAQDLRELELAYMQANTRLLEIASNVSLRRLDPLALWNLRVHGDCSFALAPSLFDLDFPQHRGRRIKSVSVSVPGVVGPYGGVNGILTCGSGSEARRIATSSGQNDAGVFQLDFRDERYLPFEGIDLDSPSNWTFVLPAALRQFDYDTISDVVLHIQYTVRNGDASPAPVTEAAAPPRLLISVRHDFPVESRQLREGHAPEGVTVVLAERLLPYFARSGVHITSVGRLGGPAELPAPSVVGANGLRLVAADAQAYFVVEYGFD